eukprot:scaffold19425_cov52-Phaeocystis_antarctica.AAC.2
MRPGLRESIESLGADGGNVGARPGAEPCSDDLELVEFARIRANSANSGRLCAPKRTDSCRSNWCRTLRAPLPARTSSPEGVRGRPLQRASFLEVPYLYGLPKGDSRQPVAPLLVNEFGIRTFGLLCPR